MVLNKQETRNLYRKRAQHYDLAMWLYRLAGVRIDRYRRLTVQGLSLQRGDTVVDLGCGTGLNFPCFDGTATVPLKEVSSRG